MNDQKSYKIWTREEKDQEKEAVEKTAMINRAKDRKGLI